MKTEVKMDSLKMCRSQKWKVKREERSLKYLNIKIVVPSPPHYCIFIELINIIIKSMIICNLTDVKFLL